MKILFETPITKNFLEIKKSFNEALFIYLKPPGVEVDIKRFDGCSKDDEIHLRLKLMGKKQDWVSLVTHDETTEAYWEFIDEGKVLPWPISYWKHLHKVAKVNETSSMIIDDISFECTPQFLAPMVAPALWLSFAIRPYKYQQYFKKS